MARLVNHPTDDGTALHLAGIKTARINPDVLKVSGRDGTDVVGNLLNGLVWTNQSTAAAVVAQMVKQKDLFSGKA